jgi:hypothetical protein
MSRKMRMGTRIKIEIKIEMKKEMKKRGYGKKERLTDY